MPVELQVEGVALVATGDVVGLRTAGSAVSCRGSGFGSMMMRSRGFVSFSGLTSSSDRPAVGRRTPREGCALKVRFSRPIDRRRVDGAKPSETGGLLLETMAQVSPGELVEIELTLDDGSVVKVRAELTREGPEGRFVGLRFIDVGRRGGGNWLPGAGAGASPSVPEHRASRPCWSRTTTRPFSTSCRRR